MSISDVVVCPKPRKTLLFNFLTEENPNLEIASSPPFIFGSPPSRASNPLIQDSQFCNHNFVAIPQELAAPPPPLPLSSAYGGGGCGPMKLGNKPAAVRIEGFNCRNSISAVA